MTNQELRTLLEGGNEAWEKLSVDELDAFREALIPYLIEVGMAPHEAMFINQGLTALVEGRRDLEESRDGLAMANASLARAYAKASSLGISPERMDAWYAEYQRDPEAAMAKGLPLNEPD